MEDLNAKALSMSNESAEWWLNHVKVLGIEETGNKNWFYPCVQYGDGTVTFLCLPYKESGGKASIFWHLDCAARIFAFERTNIPYFWAHNEPIVPYTNIWKDGHYWYTEADVIRWRKEWNKVVVKYRQYINPEKEPRKEDFKYLYRVPKDAA